MAQSKTAPLALEIVNIRLLNLAPADYTVEVSADGVRFRKKGTSRWIGPAAWESIVGSAARVSARETAAEPDLAQRGLAWTRTNYPNKPGAAADEGTAPHCAEMGVADA